VIVLGIWIMHVEPHEQQARGMSRLDHRSKGRRRAEAMA
jgi:hypothetical protein